MLNMANPAAALRWWRLPADGIGLARMEFIIGNIIRIHPMALVSFAKLKDPKARRQIAELTRGYRDKYELEVYVMCEIPSNVILAAKVRILLDKQPSRTQSRGFVRDTRARRVAITAKRRCAN